MKARLCARCAEQQNHILVEADNGEDIPTVGHCLASNTRSIKHKRTISTLQKIFEPGKIVSNVADSLLVELCLVRLRINFDVANSYSSA